MNPSRIELKNANIRAVIDTEGGRLCGLYCAAEPGINVLRSAKEGENKPDPVFPNPGGDFVWLAPQAFWKWPPIREHDSMPYKALQRKDGAVEIVSVKDARYKTSIRRLFELQGSAGSVRIHDSIINFSGKTLECAVWNITQIDTPCEVTIPFEEDEKDQFIQHVFDGDTLMDERQLNEKGYVRRCRQKIMAFPHEELWKIGITSREKSIKAVFAKQGRSFTIVKKADYAFARGQLFPEQCNVQFFNKGAPEYYCELELVCAVHSVPPNGCVTLSHTISLEPGGL